MSDPRAKLRLSITARNEAHKTKAEAVNALKRADAVLSASQTERERAAMALARSEQDHAKVIARAIRAGKSADVAVTSSIRAAQAVLSDIESRTRMAQAARDQIASELADAEHKATEADAAVADAALSVVVAECEEAAAPLERLITELCALDDIVHAAGWLRGGDGIRPRDLTPKLLQAVNRLRPLRQALNSVRPQRIILSGTSEEQTAGRLESYRKALAKNADAKLSDVAEPEIWQAPPISDHNTIEAARISAATKMGAAA